MSETLLLALMLGVGLFGNAALAADEHAGHHQTPPVADPVASAASGEGTLDAQTYFTDTLLQDQNGRTVRFYSDVLQNRVVLLNVIYTHCEDACPLITRKLKQVRAELGERAGQVHFISISSDPQNDSPQALKAFARKHDADDPNWIFLTGGAEQISLVLSRLGQLSRTPEEHSTLLIAGDVPHKRWSKIRPDAPPVAIAQRLQLLTAPLAGR